MVCDTSVLPTLPREELRSGLVEVIKMAALLDPGLLARVEERLDALLGRRSGRAGAGGRRRGRGQDRRSSSAIPDEQGDRRLLNFGHTLGHAIEAACGYAGLRHGEAVAYGMLFALRLAAARGLDPAVAEPPRDPARPPRPAAAAARSIRTS